MNWVGGSRARARARDELNRERRVCNIGETRADAGIHNDNDNVRGDDDEEQPHQRSRSRRRRREEDERLNAWKKEVDYVALGYTLIERRPVQRRVVPLLEFIERKFPRGHILSLQLSHQMDITRVYAPQPTVTPAEEEDPSVRSTPQRVDRSQSGSSSTTIASQSSIYLSLPHQPGKFAGRETSPSSSGCSTTEHGANSLVESSYRHPLLSQPSPLRPLGMESGTSGTSGRTIDRT